MKSRTSYRPDRNIARDAVLDALTQVVDPELGVDIVSLGLVYGVDVDAGEVNVTMTLTTPGCPLHETITQAVRARVEQLQGVEAVFVRLVWEPPWTPQAMSAEARRQLGWT